MRVDISSWIQQQRAQASNPNTTTEMSFYNLMKRIGTEMQHTTGALKIKSPASNCPQILNIGTAPGGFLATAIMLNPGAKGIGLSRRLLTAATEAFCRKAKTSTYATLT